jgi:hypothetical protein
MTAFVDVFSGQDARQNDQDRMIMDHSLDEIVTRDRKRFETLLGAIVAGLVPVASIVIAPRSKSRVRRDKPGDDGLRFDSKTSESHTNFTLLLN